MSAADSSKSAALPGSSTNPVVLPLEFRRGHLMVPARLDGTSTQSFVLDSGYAITMLGPGQPDALQLKRVGRVTIVGIAGENRLTPLKVLCSTLPALRGNRDA
jgi:hypothetical protein